MLSVREAVLVSQVVGCGAGEQHINTYQKDKWVQRRRVEFRVLVNFVIVQAVGNVLSTESDTQFGVELTGIKLGGIPRRYVHM